VLSHFVQKIFGLADFHQGIYIYTRNASEVNNS